MSTNLDVLLERVVSYELPEATSGLTGGCYDYVVMSFFIYTGVLGLSLAPFGSLWDALGLPWGAHKLLLDPLALPWVALGLLWGAFGLPLDPLGAP